ncbi:YkgB family protein [Pseudocolwellia agarivorans]|uniref:YkgB family protein n=1 Tax=Pseudocolwellia agarivorans TaxID=1911682 RepID=UPI003F885ABD
MNTTTIQNNTKNREELITTIGENAIRFSIALVLIWIGAMKFSAYEAGAIEGLIASSPLTSWLYSVFSLQGASNFIGTVEIATAIALLLTPLNRVVGIVGSLGAIATFAVTSSLLLTAPVWEASLGGFPALNVVPGQFLVKDLVLLAASVWLLGKALSIKK